MLFTVLGRPVREDILPLVGTNNVRPATLGNLWDLS